MTTLAHDEDKWPGVETAFGFVLPSYQWMLTRVEAADSRLHAMQVFVLTVTTALPTLAKTMAGSLSFGSWLFGLALAAATASIALGIAARAGTRITLVDPGELHSKTWLRRSEWVFKKDALYFAGQHFEQNRLLIVAKHQALMWMTLLFLCEMLLLAAWLLWNV